MIMCGTICYLTSDGKTLMIDKSERHSDKDPNSGMIVAPGGRIRADEDLRNSIIREVREESGLQLLNPEIRGTVLYDNRGRSFGDIDFKGDFFAYVFVADCYFGSLHKGTNEGVPKWIENRTIIERSYRECDKRLWRLVSDNNGKNFSAVMRHKGEMFDTMNSKVVLF